MKRTRKPQRRLLRACLPAIAVLLVAGSTAVTAGLILELDANSPGGTPASRWQPTVGDDGADAGTLDRSSAAVPLPTRNSENTNFFYTFTHTATTKGFTPDL